MATWFMLAMLLGLSVLAGLAGVIGFGKGVFGQRPCRNDGAVAVDPWRWGVFFFLMTMAPGGVGYVLGGVLSELCRAGNAIDLASMLAIAAGTSGFLFAMLQFKRLRGGRRWSEQVWDFAFYGALAISVLTSIGILSILLVNALEYFALMPLPAFLYGSSADAVVGDRTAGLPGGFTALTLLWGSFSIASIAMLIALPIGVGAAIYTAFHAGYRERLLLKPCLEMLAGIPTVAYGYFAATTVAPSIVALAAAVGLSASYNNALASGVVTGLMVLPLLSSLADDVMTAIPKELRQSGLALGLTDAETILHILLPAAAPGIVSGVLLAVSRAVGETMIVLMVGGLRAHATFNPLQDMTTISAYMMHLLTGEQSVDDPQRLAAHALGLTLFVVTLGLNVIALVLIRRFRRRLSVSNRYGLS